MICNRNTLDKTVHFEYRILDLFLAKHNVEYSMSSPRRDKGCTPLILVRLLRQINGIKPCGCKQNLYLFCLFGLRLYVSVNNFSVMSGRSHRFPGITSTFGEVNVSCSRIQHGDPSEDRTPDLSLRYPMLYH